MAEDRTHIYRVDLPEIYNECERRTALKYQAIKGQTDIDDFVITKQEYDQVHSFGMEAAARIANQCAYVKNATQSGIDALSYSSEDTSEGAFGREAGQSEKLYKKEMPDILFDIEGVKEDQNKYSIVQQFIKSAMIHYILYSWYQLKGMRSEMTEEYLAYEEEVMNVRHNAVANNRRKGVKRRYRPFG